MQSYQLTFILQLLLRNTKGDGGVIFEIVSTTLMGSLAGYSYLKKSGLSNDADKIQRIFNNAGLSIKEEGKMKTIRLQKKRKIEGGTEYIYQLPLGMSSKDVMDKALVLEDGLNIKDNSIDYSFADLLSLKLNKDIIKQIKNLGKKQKKKKEIEISFDGMLRIKVYNQGFAEKYIWDDSLLKKDTWSIPVGHTRTSIIHHNFDKDKHLIIAGATGYGKSVFLKLAVTTLIAQQPEHTHLHLIDLKGGSAFQRFKNLKQTDNFARDPEEAKQILISINKQMTKEYQSIVDKGCEDVTEADIKERHFIFIDEAADLTDHPVAMDVITSIARKGRGAGYYLIYATQYPSAQSIPQQTKRNIPIRLCYVLDDATASNTALGQTGAEQLPMIPGRGLYKNVKTNIIQTPFISNDKIARQISPYLAKEVIKIEETTTNRTDTFKLEEM